MLLILSDFNYPYGNGTRSIFYVHFFFFFVHKQNVTGVLENCNRDTSSNNVTNSKFTRYNRSGHTSPSVCCWPVPCRSLCLHYTNKNMILLMLTDECAWIFLKYHILAIRVSTPPKDVIHHGQDDYHGGCTHAPLRQ